MIVESAWSIRPTTADCCR